LKILVLYTESNSLIEKFNEIIEKINKSIDTSSFAMYKQSANPELIFKLENIISSKY